MPALAAAEGSVHGTVAVSSGNLARIARDRSLPYGRRVMALGSAVQLYRPLGFHATKEFLVERCGPVERDEDALLRAVDMIEESRGVRTAEVNRFAAARSAAKREGRRTPAKAEIDPLFAYRWWGDELAGASYAIRYYTRLGFPDRVAPHVQIAETTLVSRTAR